MKVEIKKLLFDIFTAISSIEDFTKDIANLEEYRNSKLQRRAVEREIEIIGEATKRILQTDDNFPLTNARQIIDTRNWVIHAYDNVDDIIIWGIVTIHLPKLKDEVSSFLDSE